MLLSGCVIIRPLFDDTRRNIEAIIVTSIRDVHVDTHHVVQPKRGCGKDHDAVNLGAALAEQEQRVLMVDLDPQGALTAYWGLETENSQVTIYQLLLNDSLPATDAIRRVRERIDVIPADIDLAAAEIELFSALGRERILKELLSKVQDGYDFVLVDCPPNLGLLTVNALVACHGVIIPLQCEYFAMRGLSMLLDTLQ